MSINSCVIKIGGSCLEQDVRQVAEQAIALARGRPCIYVHGYGPELRRLLAKLSVNRSTFVSASGMPSHFTTEEVAIVSELAAARVRSKLDALFATLGVPVHSGPAYSDALVVGTRKDRIRYNDRGVIRVHTADFSGKVTSVSTEKISQHLSQHGNLLLSPVLRDMKQRAIVVDGDALAIELGIAVRAQAMYVLSDSAGVLVDGKTVREVRQTAISQLATHTTGGMTRKIKHIQQGLRGGIGEVLLLKGSSTIEAGLYNGTRFRQD